MAVQTAISTRSLIDSIGVNTHIDFVNYGYQNLTTVAASINYLGIKNIRDSVQTAADATTWLQVANATGAKFDDYIAATSPAGMTTDLGFATQLAQAGILNFLEGGNEEDDAYPAGLGNTLEITAQFQQQVYATGHSLGLPVINMSFGSGWTAANNWQGDYGGSAICPPTPTMPTRTRTQTLDRAPTGRSSGSTASPSLPPLRARWSPPRSAGMKTRDSLRPTPRSSPSTP